MSEIVTGIGKAVATGARAAVSTGIRAAPRVIEAAKAAPKAVEKIARVQPEAARISADTQLALSRRSVVNAPDNTQPQIQSILAELATYGNVNPVEARAIYLINPEEEEKQGFLGQFLLYIVKALTGISSQTLADLS